MTLTRQPKIGNRLALILCIAVGISVIAVFLIVLGIRAIIAPTHFAVLKYGGVARATSKDGHSVYIRLALTERDDFPQLDAAHLDGASNASLVQFGWLVPPLGCAAGQTQASRTELEKAFAGSRSPRPLPSTHSDLVLRAVVDPTRPASADAVDLRIDNGEPAFYQTLTFHLNARGGHCSVGKG